jgi:hypothetical protein
MTMESHEHDHEHEDGSDYARGLDHDEVDEERQGRFSEGQEELPPDTPEKLAEGRFSEGQEELPRQD